MNNWTPAVCTGSDVMVARQRTALRNRQVAHREPCVLLWSGLGSQYRTGDVTFLNSLRDTSQTKFDSESRDVSECFFLCGMSRVRISAWKPSLLTNVIVVYLNPSRWERGKALNNTTAASFQLFQNSLIISVGNFTTLPVAKIHHRMVGWLVNDERIRKEVDVKSIIFWDMTQCSPLSVNQHFGGTYRLHLQGRKISQARNQRESRWQAGWFLAWLIFQLWR
jgi:hypothetical protein